MIDAADAAGLIPLMLWWMKKKKLKAEYRMLDEKSVCVSTNHLDYAGTLFGILSSSSSSIPPIIRPVKA